MNSWLYSIIGIIFVGILIDIITPNGKINKFIKSIYTLFVLFVFIEPIANKLTNIPSLEYQYFELNSNILYTINQSKFQALEDRILNKCSLCGINKINVTIDGNMYNEDIEINYIYVDISNIVLSEDLSNINKYEMITKSIKDVVEIDKENIIFYG